MNIGSSLVNGIMMRPSPRKVILENLSDNPYSTEKFYITSRQIAENE